MALLLGIDLGGTKTAFALGDIQGVPQAQTRRPTESSGDPRADLRRMATDLRGLLADAGAELADVAHVGVSVPGPLDLERGVLLRPPNLPGWNEVPVRDILAQDLGRPVSIENDANAAALAEWHHGAGQGANHLVYLTMSTGVGGGLILDSRLYRGVRTGAGEIGHTVVEWDGEPCGCGLRGCAEAYLGGRMWQQRLRVVTPPRSRVTELAGSVEAVKPEHLVEAAREGDAFALGEMARFNDYLARVLVNVAFTLAPEVVVLGTIVVAAGEALCLEPVRTRVAERTWPHLSAGMQIVPAALGSALPSHAGLSVALEAMKSGQGQHP